MVTRMTTCPICGDRGPSDGCPDCLSETVDWRHVAVSLFRTAGSISLLTPAEQRELRRAFDEASALASMRQDQAADQITTAEQDLQPWEGTPIGIISRALASSGYEVDLISTVPPRIYARAGQQGMIIRIDYGGVFTFVN